jgi:hypothetical protein
MRRIISPSAAFVNLWARSQIVLEYYTEGSLFFLNKLPKELAATLRHLVITGALLSADDRPTCVAWFKDNNTGELSITRFLTDKFPKLNTVAIEVPGRYEGMEWNWNPANDYFCDVLRERRLDTVRFFYKEDVDHIETDENFLKHVALAGESSDEESDKEEQEMDLIGIDKLTSSTSQKPELWRDLGVNRVVKITKAQAN